MRKNVSDMLGSTRIIPVLVIEEMDQALPLAQCLVDNGLPILEITMRSDVALKAIEEIATKVDGAVTGVGSILTPENLKQSQDAGGEFGVSPGVSLNLLEALKETDMPFLPAAATIGEILTLRDAGFMEQKLFPAAVLGGIPMLKSIAGPVRDVRFCPTGGVKPDNAADYLATSNVFVVGGTWIAPNDLVRDRNWAEIGRRAAEAAKI